MLNRILTCLLFLLSILISRGQNIPQITFIAFNADAQDDFAFVTLNSINANTTIFFTDNEALNDSAISSGEGILSWTSTSFISSGTVVIVSNAGSNSNISVNHGSIQNSGGNFNLSASGDALFAYMGPNKDHISHWLAGIENSANQAGNLAATGLTQSQNFIQFYQSSSPDGAYYNGSRTSELSFNGYRSLIYDPLNWQEEVSNGSLILPISDSSFTLNGTVAPQVLVEASFDSVNFLPVQGQQTYLIAEFKLFGKHDSTVLQSVEFVLNGNAEASDFYAFDLSLSLNGNLNYSQRIANISMHLDTLTFSSIGLNIAPGDSLILQFHADIDSNANSLHSFNLAIPRLILSKGSQIDSIGNNQLHQFTDLVPRVIFSHQSFSSQVDSIAQKTLSHVLHGFKIQSVFKPCSLQRIQARLLGNYDSADISIFKLWASSNALFDSIEDQIISSSAIDSSGNLEFSGLNALMQANAGNHFFITVDLTCQATIGNTIRIAILDSSAFRFDRLVEKQYDAGSSAQLFFLERAPQNVQALSYQPGNNYLSISWSNSPCNEEVLIIAHNQAFTDSPIGQYTVISNSFIDSLNSLMPSGARAVYSGLGSNIIISGLINGQHYYFMIFTRKGTQWSLGQSFDRVLATSPALIISQYYEGLSQDKWIEITNVGDTVIDLSGYYLARWSNTSQPNGSASSSNQLMGTLLPAASLLMKHSSAQLPTYANGNSGGVLAFNGDDVMALCLNSNLWEDRVDCIYSQSVWGQNTAFYRKPHILAPSQDISILDGTGEWLEVSNTIVDSALIGTSARLGEHQFGLPTGDFTFDGINWIPQSPIGASTFLNSIVVQSGVVNLNSDISCAYVNVLQEATLNLNLAMNLHVGDSIINDGEIVLGDGSEIIQLDSNTLNKNSGFGRYRIKRTFQATAADRFKLWSSPLNDASIETCFANTNTSDRYSYQSGGQNPGYKTFVNGIMQAGKAYALTPNVPAVIGLKNFSDSVYFVGNHINNGNIQVFIDSLNPGNYVLLGNPYPSAIDFNLFLAENPTINGSLWFWDASPNDKGNSAFAVWNNQGGLAVGNSKKSAPTNQIQAMQGFIVRTNSNLGSNTSQNFLFNNKMRINSSNSSARFFKDSSPNPKIYLRLHSKKADNICLIAMDTNASFQFDEKYDATIYKANLHQSFYSIADQKHLSIQTIDDIIDSSVVIPLGLDAWHLGNFTISLDSLSLFSESLGITLIDSLNHFKRDLKTQAYSFAVSQIGVNTERFFLKLSDGDMSIISNSETEEVAVSIFQNSKGEIEINLKNIENEFIELELLSLNGKLLESWKLEERQKHYYFKLPKENKGFYLLKLNSKQGRSQSRKIYLR
jgi:hypothetical protein